MESVKVKVEVSCCMCGEKYESEITLPDGWSMRYDEIYEENGFCQKHSAISEWADEQCPGCVGGWNDCDLWRAFACRDRNLTEEDFAIIRSGKCPKRTNGTFMFSSKTGLVAADMASQATTKSGEVFADAIKEYWEKYL